MSEEPTERDDGPYEGWSIPAIIHNYVVIRGDLSEQYARDQLADLIAERIAQARREGAADELDRQADGIDPGDHHCFKPWCPHCAMRKTREQQRDGLHKRAAALRDDA